MIIAKDSSVINISEEEQLNEAQSVGVLVRAAGPKYTSSLKTRIKYGYSRYKDNPAWVSAYNKCVGRELKKSFGPIAVTTLYEALRNKQYTKAAKKLIKLGVKGSLPGFVISLAFISNGCNAEATKKHYKWVRK